LVKRMKGVTAFALLVLLFLSGCGGLADYIPLWPTATGTATVTPTLGPTYTPTATPQAELSMRVMAYNIWFGAGAVPVHPERGPENRMDDLIAFIQDAAPDLLGLEELTEWTGGTPSIIQSFAATLNMEYYVAETPSGFPMALFSRYPILEGENLSERVGNNGALRATVQIPTGSKLVVVVVHLDPNDPMLRACEFDRLRRILEPYRDQPAILMGDINTLPGGMETKPLIDGGWQLVRSQTIDDIFIWSRQAWTARPMCFSSDPSTPDCILQRSISDHRPVGAILSLYGFENSFQMRDFTITAPLPGCD
jgi:endonuclease/exonuclease/phosphatase (EEP) superfamily protein YafD